MLFDRTSVDEVFVEIYGCTMEQLFVLFRYMSYRRKYRTVIFYANWFSLFFNKQAENVKKKIIWTLELIEDLQRIPESYLKHITGADGLYEIRVKVGNNIFRIFCFFDQGNLVVAVNGFQKKDQKTPRREIEMALKIMEEYFNEK